MTKNVVKMAPEEHQQQSTQTASRDDNRKHANPKESSTDNTKVITSENYVAQIKKFYCKLTNHDYDTCFSSYTNFSNLMFKPVDSASLGVGRMLFGFMMLLDIPEERSGAELDYRWGEPKDCRFTLFTFLTPMTLPRMGIAYAVMWLGALGITLGYKFRLTCTMFLIPYWYIFLLDKSSWNNHSYLYGLIGSILVTTNANRFCSVDAWLHQSNANDTVPFWNYFLIKFQFFVLYFLAGMKKMCSEWLSGYAMAHLGNHWIFSPFRLFLGSKMTDLLIIHWFGAFFDLTVTFFLIYELTRPMATLFAASFHLMNSRLFSIGMFPWVCLVELPIFYHHDWPKYMLHRLTFGRAYNQYAYVSNGKSQAMSLPCEDNSSAMCCESQKKSRSSFTTKKSKSFVILNNKKINNNSGGSNNNNNNNNLAKEQKNLIRDDFTVQYRNNNNNNNRNNNDDNDSHNKRPFIFVKQFYNNLFVNSKIQYKCKNNNNRNNNSDSDSACKIKQSSPSGKEQSNEKFQNKFSVSQLPSSSSSSSSSTFLSSGKTKKMPSVKTQTGKQEERHKKIVTAFIIIYCGLQIFLPYSHFITKGYNNWTNGLYGYSWDMMVHAWDTVLVSVKVVDNQSGRVHFMEPYAFSETDRWTKHGDMAYQYAKCIEKNLLNDITNTKGANKLKLSTNFSIYFDVWCSLNGRFQQRFYNPNVDMRTVQWSPFKEPSFVLPLLKEFTRYRPKLEQFTEEVISWSNHTDVMYIADFPNFVMDNYISNDLDNITLTVLEGTIKFIEEHRKGSITVNKGQHIRVTPNLFHKVKTISETPSSYMYTYVNKTMEIEEKTQLHPNHDDKPLLPLKEEFIGRLRSYKKFMMHLGNSFLFEMYGVPMPIRKKH